MEYDITHSDSERNKAEIHIHVCLFLCKSFHLSVSLSCLNYKTQLDLSSSLTLFRDIVIFREINVSKNRSEASIT